VLTALALKAPGESKVHQCVECDVGDSKHVPASAAVTTVWATELFVLLVAKRSTAVAPVTGGNINRGFVYKFHSVILGG
jgi:hypothetical protein